MILENGLYGYTDTIMITIKNKSLPFKSERQSYQANDDAALT